jgi:adenosylcobinamide kinase / adenosylcobinamide-phosphate guanylyltransferase
MKQLILGGARSGKSGLAEQQAKQSGKQVVYIATADRRHNDAEMDARIAHHKQQRPSEWPTIEAPVELAAALQASDSSDHCILVDCLTLWLTNCLFSDAPNSPNNTWEEQRQTLLDTLPTLSADIILVSNEVGWGIVPMGEVNRRFVDETGFLHQAIAPLADRVILTAAGLPMVLKGKEIKGKELKGEQL